MNQFFSKYKKPAFLLVLIAAALFLRVYYLYYLYPIDKYVFSDMKMYLDNANALVTGEPTQGCFWRFRFKGSLRIGMVHCLGLNIFLMAYLLSGELRYRILFDTVFLPLAVGTWLKFTNKLKLRAFFR